MEKKMRVAILGFGGLGRNAARILSMKQEFQLVVSATARGSPSRNWG